MHNHLILRLNALVQASRKFASASKLSCRLHDAIAIACLLQRTNVFCSTGMTLSRNLRPRHTCCRSIDSFKCALATTVTDSPNPKFGRLKLPAEDFKFERGGEAPGRRRCMPRWRLSSILTNARPHLVLVVPATVERTKDSWQSEEYFTKLRSLPLEVFYQSSSAQA